MDIIRLKETDSTNMRAKDAGNKGVSTDTLFVADRQTAGVGRRGRSWESPEGDNIYMSLLLKPELETKAAPMLTLVMAVSVAEAINNVCGADVQIKWPNDLVMNGKKLCGILTEMALDGSNIKYVVIGVGINVNQKYFSAEIRKKATSLSVELSKDFERDVIMDAVLERFFHHYKMFLGMSNLSFLLETYNRMLVNRDKEVVIHEPGNEYEARAIGINQQGELIVETLDGNRQEIYAGEVSVRGIYGYV